MAWTSENNPIQSWGFKLSRSRAEANIHKEGWKENGFCWRKEKKLKFRDAESEEQRWYNEQKFREGRLWKRGDGWASKETWTLEKNKKKKWGSMTQILGSNSSRESGKRDGGAKRKLSQASWGE